ncbi:response regulator [Paenibacillus sp. FSL R7-0312]|uniref:response regulator n=1 Tax=unclassified Paenibacillus TaxID=185978 RepID=UPI0004F8170D|nr:response regulator [Paenibacillus sp. FSL R5-0912]AIQ40860.1 AraC family transcriptional regulator [Paenibacillus sp. FSL R5-0912]
MYRLLIVDDEEIITDGLYEAFNQLIPDKLDVYKVYSAKAALEWLSRTRIDIVLTDIRMPGMSGLEMSEQIREFWPRSRIVFLTGYSEFDYAYRALQIPGARYLLKTEGFDKIIETVQEVLLEIEQGNQLSELLEQSREQRDSMEIAAQGDYLRHLLQDSQVLCADVQTLSTDFLKLGISLEPGSPVMLILGRLTYPEGTSYMDRSEILTSSRLIWNSHLAEMTRHTWVLDRHGDLLWLLQPLHHAEAVFGGHLSRYLEGTLELIQDSFRQTLGLPVAFTVSGSACAWTEIGRHYERLHRLQQVKIGDGISMVQIDRSGPPEPDGIRETGVRLQQRVENLAAHLDAGRRERFAETLEEITEGIHSSVSVEEAAELYYTAALVLLSHLNRSEYYSLVNEYSKLMRLDEHSSLKEGFYYLEKLASDLFELRSTAEKERSLEVIERICEYIHSHLGEDLSLVRLAELHYFNPSYLSRFFKQEQGINLSEFIDHCRAVKAKELLGNEALKIRDVALYVGYEAPHSFTRFFKKMTGMTPQEFRESMHIKL